MKFITSAFVLILLLAVIVHAEPGKLRMHVINVGQAESILLEMPSHAILIDTGGEDTKRDQTEGSFYRDELTKYLDNFFAGNPHLENTLYALIVSHPHKDHTKYLKFIMDRYKVQNFIEGGHPNSSHDSGMADIKTARQLADQKGIRRISVKYNTVDSQALQSWANALNQGSGVRVRFLSGRRGCNDANNDSLVMRVDYGQKSILLTGDSEKDDLDFHNPGNVGCGGQLPYLLSRYANNLSVLDVDVYKVGHHGSRNATYEAFLKAVSPEYAIVSAGNHRDRSPGDYHGYQYGHPNERTVKLLESFVSASRPQPVNVYTMKGPTQVINNRTVSKGIYCTCWGAKAVVVTLSNDGTPIGVTEVAQ